MYAISLLAIDEYHTKTALKEGSERAWLRAAARGRGCAIWEEEEEVEEEEKGEEDKEEEGAEGKGSREIKDPPGSGGVDRLGQEKKPLLRQKSDQLRSELC